MVNLCLFKKKVAFFLLFSFIIVQSQVTIGSSDPPLEGVLLNVGGQGISNKGLLMPRVELTDLNTLTVAKPSEGTVHTGLLVYNVTDKPTVYLCPGLHVWMGDKWKRLYGTCGSNDPILFQPNTLIFTSGEDSYSLGYKANPNFPGSSTQEYITTETGARLQRPIYENDPTYWPFIIKWKPSNYNITLTQLDNLVSLSKNFPSPIVPNSTEGEFSVYTASASNYQNFITLNSIKNSSYFTGGNVFRSSWPYVVNSSIETKMNEDASIKKNFIIRQINYGVDISLMANIQPWYLNPDAGGNNYKYLWTPNVPFTLTLTIEANASWVFKKGNIGGGATPTFDKYINSVKINGQVVQDGYVRTIESPNGDIDKVTMELTVNAVDPSDYGFVIPIIFQDVNYNPANKDPNALYRIGSGIGGWQPFNSVIIKPMELADWNTDEVNK